METIKIEQSEGPANIVQYILGSDRYRLSCIQLHTTEKIHRIFSAFCFTSRKVYPKCCHNRNKRTDKKHETRTQNCYQQVGLCQLDSSPASSKTAHTVQAHSCLHIWVKEPKLDVLWMYLACCFSHEGGSTYIQAPEPCKEAAVPPWPWHVGSIHRCGQLKHI